MSRASRASARPGTVSIGCDREAGRRGGPRPKRHGWRAADNVPEVQSLA